MPEPDLPPAPEPAFVPTMPYAVAVPWPAPWASVIVWYDQYAVERFIDEEPTIMAAARRDGRALEHRRTARQGRATAIEERSAALNRRAAAFAAQVGILSESQRAPIAAQLAQEQAAWAADLPQRLAALQDDEDAWAQDVRGWRKAQALIELGYYVLRVEWPDGTDRPGSDPDTWARFPLKLLEWLTHEGYTQARDGLWAAATPKVPPPAETAPA